MYRCISASAVCANGDIVASALPSVGVDVKANLAPALGDVDLGTDFGLQFAASAVGDFLDVPVRVNAASGKLYSYQIDVVWDSAHFKATACTVGGGWAASSVIRREPRRRTHSLSVGPGSAPSGNAAAHRLLLGFQQLEGQSDQQR